MAISPNKEFVAICEKMKDDDNELRKNRRMFQFMKLKKRLLNQSKEAKAEVLIILKQI